MAAGDEKERMQRPGRRENSVPPERKCGA